MGVTTTSTAPGQHEERAARLGRAPFAAAFVVSASLVAANFVLKWMQQSTGRVDPVVLRFFDVNHEHNLPTFRNAALVVVLGAAGAHLMAADETLLIHEPAMIAPAERLAAAGLTTNTYRWVLPGAVLAAVVARWPSRGPDGCRTGLVADC